VTLEVSSLTQGNIQLLVC